MHAIRRSQQSYRHSGEMPRLLVFLSPNISFQIIRNSANNLRIVSPTGAIDIIDVMYLAYITVKGFEKMTSMIHAVHRNIAFDTIKQFDLFVKIDILYSV